MAQRAVKKATRSARRPRTTASAARAGRTREELISEAAKLGVTGRWRMNKQQLTRAVAAKKAARKRRRTR